jgi:hypothetical protein
MLITVTQTRPTKHRDPIATVYDFDPIVICYDAIKIADQSQLAPGFSDIIFHTERRVYRKLTVNSELSPEIDFYQAILEPLYSMHDG